MKHDAPSAVVVGAGVIGSSIAHELACRGWSVTIVEQYSPAHVRASSHDSSRVFRLAHGDEDPAGWYTASARRARELWLGIGDEEGVELLAQSGAVWFAHRDDGFEAISETILERLGLPVERLSPDAAHDFFPEVTVEDLRFLLYEPHGGILRASLCVHTLIDRAERFGAALVSGRALPAGDGRASIDGRLVDADRTIWACGAWLGSLFPEHADVRATRQTLFYFGVDARWRTPGVPVWVDDDLDAYGLGDFDGAGFKATWTKPAGDYLDPDLGSRLPDEASERRTRRYLSRRFPALAEAPIVAARVCQYELTPDRHFLLSPLADDERAWLMGGGSGHAFKHGPALGEYAADLLEGHQRPRGEFRLGRRVPRPELDRPTVRVPATVSNDEARAVSMHRPQFPDQEERR